MTVSTPEMLPAAPEPASEANSKKVLLAAGLAAAVALGGAGYFLLLAGGEQSATESPGTAVSRSTASKVGTTRRVAPATRATTAKPAMVPAVSTVPLGRDPFRALYILRPAVSNTAPTTSAPTVVASAPSGGGTTTSQGSTTTAPKSYAMSLKRVYGSGSQRTAEFVIGGKTMLAKVGSVFGPTSELKLLSVGQNAKGAWVATIQVGDDEPFDAIQNQTVYVR